MIRQHQFDKVELVHISNPDDFLCGARVLVGHAEADLEASRLGVSRVALCGGDIGFGAAKTYDLEVWLPGQGSTAKSRRAATAKRSKRGACRHAGAIPRPASLSSCTP